MASDKRAEDRILQSWLANAGPWTAAVREGSIESRIRVTNAAILDAVRSLAPDTVLDVGCGEGWLARTLVAEGIDVTGVDGVEALVEAARVAGPGEYHCLSYEELAAGRLQTSVDVIVCNFSLFGDASVERLVSSFPALLRPGGALVIQTLHPITAGGVLPYRDGWREGSWDSLGPAFDDPPPWYFRTLESWLSLLRNGFKDVTICEPQDPSNQQPESLIMVARNR